jgi:hypothetical protein
VRFGIFCEHQLPRPWEPESEQRTLQEPFEVLVVPAP